MIKEEIGMQTMTEHERKELEETGELRLVNPDTMDEYVALPQRIYDRVKNLLQDDGIDVRGTYGAVLRAWDQDGPDPGLADYQKYRRKS
jgi:hypothetical protein